MRDYPPGIGLSSETVDALISFGSAAISRSLFLPPIWWVDVLDEIARDGRRLAEPCSTENGF